MDATQKRITFQAWAGFFAGAVAWATDQQGSGDLLYWDCRLGGPVASGLAGIAALVLTGLGALISWRVWRASDVADPSKGGQRDARRFIALFSLMSAGLFTVAILFTTLAGFLVPECHR